MTVLDKLENLTGVTTRFVARPDPEEVRDLHSGGPKGQVKRLFHVLKVFWETEKEQLGDYLLIPVAQLERSGEEIKLSERFIPPCLTLSGSDPLIKIIKEIRDQIAARSRQLEEYKRQRGIQTAEFGSRDMVYLLALSSLNRYVPAPFPFDGDPAGSSLGRLRSPAAAHRRALVLFGKGQCVWASWRSGSRLLPNYDHLDLWECFSAAQDLISQLLDEITAGPEYVIRLIYDGTYFAAELKPAIFEGRNRFYLVFKTEEDPKSVLQSLETVAKLGRGNICRF